jgi:hypothetical protein
MRRHVYFYTYLERPFAEAQAIFVDAPERWLPLPAHRSNGGFVVDLDASMVIPDRLAQRSAIVMPSGPLPGVEDTSVLRPIVWSAADREDWFPVLDGDLELCAVSESSCQLTLTGSYRPPLSVVGTVGDTLVGHRIAESVVRMFVLAAAARIAADTQGGFARRTPSVG